jgi:tetratricopeptide (TPR) repeat protein
MRVSFSIVALALAACGPKAPVTTVPVEGASAAPVAPVVAEAAPATPIAPADVTAAPAAPVDAAAGGASPSPTGLSEDARRSFDDAVAMLTTADAGRAQRALEMLSPLAGQYPDIAALHYNIGVAHQVLGRDVDARRAWTRATEVDPTAARAWLNLGVLGVTEGRPDVALSQIQSGIRYAPSNVELRVVAIGVLRSLKRYDEAKKEARAALQINTRSVPIYNNLALVYLDTAEYDLAKFVLQKALADIEGAAQNAQLHAVLGEVYLRQSLPGDALSEFKKALDLDPMNLPALQFLANYHLDNRAWADAIALLERAAQGAPKDAGIRLSLGIAYRGEGRFDDAKRVYEDALRLDPRNPEPYRNLAVLYGDSMKSYDAAVDSIEKYRQAGGGTPAELDQWVSALRKEQKRIEDRKKREAKQREAEAAEAAAAAAAAAQLPAPVEVVTPPPVEVVPPAPAPVPAEVVAPAPSTAPTEVVATPQPAPAADPNVWGAQPAEPAPAPVPTPSVPAEPAPAPAPAPAEGNPWGGG